MVVCSIDELNDAIQKAVPGAVIQLKNGIYNDAQIKLSLPDPDNQPKGTLPVSHIAIQAESYGGVIFTGNSSITAKGSFLTIEGFVWQDTTSTSVLFNNVDDSTLTRNSFIHAGPSDDGTVRITSGSARNNMVRNRFENLPAQGIRITCSASGCNNVDNHIAHNLFIAKAETGGNVGESIQLGSGYQGSVRYVGDLRTIVEHNLFQDIAPSQEMISNKTNLNVFRYNTFRDTRDKLVLRMGTGAQVYENWFINAMGIRAHETGHHIHDNYMENITGPAIVLPIGQNSSASGCIHWPADDVHVEHNTIINTTGFGIQIGGSSMDNDDCTYTQVPKNGVYASNLIVDFTESAIKEYESLPQTYVDNIAWPASGSSVGVTQADPTPLTRNELGAYVSSSYSDRGAKLHCRALTVDDVGPASTYACNTK